MKIFENMISYFEKFFSKTKKLDCGTSKQEMLHEKENVFLNTLQKDNKDYFNKKTILEQIDQNPELIYSLSYSRLVQLNGIYEERISELERKISQAQ